jgi:hypothetical protein
MVRVEADALPRSQSSSFATRSQAVRVTEELRQVRYEPPWRIGRWRSLSLGGFLKTGSDRLRPPRRSLQLDGSDLFVPEKSAFTLVTDRRTARRQRPTMPIASRELRP